MANSAPLRRWLQIAIAVVVLQDFNFVSCNVHIAYLTDCTMYSDWQTVAMAFSFKQSRQHGKITRIMCCKDDQKARYDHQLLNLMPTLVAPSYEYNNRTKDHYAAYNKPAAVVEWFKHTSPTEEYALVLDSDMLLRKPFTEESYNLSKGWCVSADYTYMWGVQNELADRHIPEIPGRDDELAGPRGRKADMVGGFFYLHVDDLKRIAPLWLSITEEVREDPEAWRLTGDQYVEKGGKPWISEMYGYAFAAAKCNIWHRWDKQAMHYPTYDPTGIPRIIHYGLLWDVADFKFDKHWHYDFDVTKCPPWDLSDPKRRTAGIFPNPPRPSILTTKNNPVKYYHDLLAIETVINLNAAFCDYHLTHCPPSQQLLDVCTEVLSIYQETVLAVKDAEATFSACIDSNVRCADWAAQGECINNMGFMERSCRKACNKCGDSLTGNKLQEDVVPSTTDFEEILAKVAATLKKDSSTGDSSGSSGGSQGGSIIATQTVAQADAGASSGSSSPVLMSRDIPAMVVTKPLDTPSQQVIITSGASSFQTTSSPSPVAAKTRKDLLLRCYRMALTLDKVKDCVAAATEGREYTDTTTASHADDDKAVERKLEQRDISVGDADDLAAAGGSAESPSVAAPALATWLMSWQAGGIWLLVVAVFLFVSRRMFKARRRARSGMRQE